METLMSMVGLALAVFAFAAYLRPGSSATVQTATTAPGSQLPVDVPLQSAVTTPADISGSAIAMPDAASLDFGAAVNDMLHAFTAPLPNSGCNTCQPAPADRSASAIQLAQIQINNTHAGAATAGPVGLLFG
jgi:hypothetical protein